MLIMKLRTLCRPWIFAFLSFLRVSSADAQSFRDADTGSWNDSVQQAPCNDQGSTCVSGCSGCCDQACDSCDSFVHDFGHGACLSQSGSLLGLSSEASCCSPYFFNAYIAHGFGGNPDNPSNNSNLPVGFNDRANEYLMNQLYFSVGKKVRHGSDFDIGGRFDLLYGSDYFFTTARGLETRDNGSPRWNSGNGPRGAGAAIYGLAMPQLYAEIYAPFGQGVSVKLGHFYTIIGNESVMAKENFFYSHSYSMLYGQPFTHTGGLAKIKGSNGFDYYAGITRGWDTFDTGNAAFLGGVSWENCDATVKYSFAISTGDEDNLNGFSPSRDNRTVFTNVYQESITDRTRYVIEQTFGVEENAVSKGAQVESGQWYGINQYLFHDLTCTTTAGLRVDWFRDEDNLRVLGIPIASQTAGGNYVGITGGLNWKPSSWFNLRPEIRYDWSDAAAPIFGRQRMFNDFQDGNQITLSFDAIVIL
jgi:Putative beta-barrel porin-2, OmpL-like. bbp2